MIPGEGRGRLQKQNKGIKESTNCILPHHPRNGRTSSLPKSWSFADLNVQRHWLEDGIPACRRIPALRSIRLNESVGSAARLLHAHSVLLLAWWAGNEPGRGGSRPEGGIWNLPQVGSGNRSKDSFRQNCDKVSWFSQLLEERWVLEFTAWVSEFFRLQVRQILHYLSTVPPLAAALRVRSVRKSGHNLL